MILVESRRVMRIAVLEHVNAVVADARDPDISFRVRRHSHCSDRASLVAIRRRYRVACPREARNASISIRRWIAARAVSPTEVAEPHCAGAIDGDAVTCTENAATEQRRPGRAIAAIGRLAVGFEHQVEIT